MATNKGPLYIKSDEVGQDNVVFYQEKVPRNDGTNLADYLLTGIGIYMIAIDGGGRKWFGTVNNGVFLVSEDNMTQLQHFTSENSHLYQITYCLSLLTVRQVRYSSLLTKVFVHMLAMLQKLMMR